MTLSGACRKRKGGAGKRASFFSGVSKCERTEFSFELDTLRPNDESSTPQASVKLTDVGLSNPLRYFNEPGTHDLKIPNGSK